MRLLPIRTALGAVAVVALTACGSTVAPSGLATASGTDTLGSPELGSAGGALPEGVVPPEAAQADPLTGGVEGIAGEGTGPDSPGPVAGPAAPAPGSAPVPGAPGAQPAAPTTSRVTSPISVGFVVEEGSGQQANESAGVSTGQSITLRKLYSSLVAALNGSGGLAGRKIEPVYGELNPAAPSYDSELAEACATFTQDNQVAAVADVVGYTESYEQCLSQGGAFHIAGSSGSTVAASLARWPALMNVAAPAIERRERAVVQRLAANGLLKPGTKVGVVVDACPDTRLAYERAFKPAAEKAGLQLDKVEVTCANGYSDLGPLGAALQNAVLRFQSSGVTVVSFVSNVASTDVLLFAPAAESQGYRPQYALTSNAQPVALALNVPRGQLRGMRGVGWLPSLDVAVNKLPARTAAQNRCLALLKSQGVVPAGSADFYLAYTTCDTVFALERLLKDSNGVSDRGALTAAARALGTSYAPVITFADRFSAQGLDGPELARTFRYTEACSCFEYDGGLEPMR
jgi:hypothetical protein